MAGDDPVQRAFELASTAGDAVGDELHDVVAELERGVLATGIGKAHLEDVATQLELRSLDIDDQTAGKAPFQTMWEFMDAGYLEIESRLPQGPMRYEDAGDGRMRLAVDSELPRIRSQPAT